MSNTIDSKVVEMRFDNQHFESNVKTSLSTLDRLKQSLSFTKQNTGIDNISSSLDGTNKSASSLAKGVETVKMNFSAMEIIAISALNNITNRAVNAGVQLVKALTVDPVRTGFQEYELKMGAVQTIMASTGENITTVNRYLEELNLYADKTIYSFSDMTNSIGKFTNSGVKLETAVAAIKGISNEAAISGANANEASRAMYNFAQAISTGSVKLIDWKSIENANMATAEFKQQLIDTAVACGTLSKRADGMYDVLSTNSNGSTFKDVMSNTKNFNDSLSYQWMTTEVLVKTLERYADESTDIGKRATAAATEVKTLSMMMDALKEAAQSGWSTTWELIVGDLEQAKKFWTPINDAISDMIGMLDEARNSRIEDIFSGPVDKMKSKFNEMGISFDDFQNKLIELGKAEGSVTEEMVKNGIKMEDVFPDWVTDNMVVQALREMGGAAEEVKETVVDLESVVKRVINGEFGNGADRVKALTEAGFDYAEVQDLVNKTLEGQEVNYKKVSTEQLKSMGYTEEQIKFLRELADEAEKSGTSMSELMDQLQRPPGRVLLLNIITNTLNSLRDIMKTIGLAWKNVFPETIANSVYNLLQGVERLTSSFKIFDSETGQLTATGDKLVRTFQGIFSIFKVISTFFSGGLRIALYVIQRVLENLNIDILDVTATIGDWITKTVEWIENSALVNAAIQFLSSALETFIDWATKGLSIIEEWIPKIKEFASGLKGIPEVKEVGLALKSFADGLGTDFMGTLNNFFAGLGSGDFTVIVDAIKAANHYVQDNMIDKVIDTDSLKLNLADGIDSVLNFWTDSKKNFDLQVTRTKDYMSGSIETMATRFKKDVVGVTKGISDTIEENIGSVAVLATDGVVVLAIKQWADTLKSVENLITSFNTNITGFVTSITSAIKKISTAVSVKLYAQAFKDIAWGILIVAGALIALTFVDTGKLWNSVWALGAIMLAMAALVGVLTLLNKFGGRAGKLDLFGLAAMFIGLAVLFWAFKSISDLEWGTIGKGAAIIAIGLLAFVAVAYAMKSLGIVAGQTKGVGTTILAMAVGLYVVVSALKKLAKIDTEALYSNLLPLIGVMVVMGIIGGLMSALKGAGIGKSMLSMAFSLVIFVGALWLIANLDLSGLESKIGTLIGIFSAFAVLMLISRAAGDNAMKAGGSILMISIAMGILAATMKIICGMSSSELAKGLTVIGFFTAFISALIFVSMYSGAYADKAGKMLTKVAFAVAILAAVVWAVGNLPQENIDRGLTVVGFLTAFIDGLIFVTKYAGSSVDKLAKFLWSVTAVIAVMGIMVVALSYVPPEKLENGLKAILGIGAIIGALMFLSKYANTSGKAIAVILSIVAAIGVIGYVLYKLKDLDPGTSLTNATALTEVMAAVGGLMYAMSKLGDGIKWGGIAKSAVMMVIGLAAIAGIVAALKVMDDLNVDNALSNATAIGILMGALSFSLNAIGSSNIAFDAGLIVKFGVMAACLVLVGGVLALLEHFNIELSISKAIALGVLLTALSASLWILSNVHSVSIKAVVGLTGMVVILGAVAYVLNMISGMNLDIGLDKVIMLGTTIGALTIVMFLLQFIPKVNGWAIVGLAGMTAVLYAVGICLDQISKMDLSISLSNIFKLIVVVGALTLLTAALSLIGPVALEAIFGVGALIVVVGALTGALTYLANHVDPGMADKINAIIPVLQSVGEALGAFAGGTIGGLLSATADGITKFAESLGTFGSAMKTFGESIKDINADDMGNILTLAQSAKTISEAGLDVDDDGVSKLAKFGQQLNEFAGPFVVFCNSMKEADIADSQISNISKSIKLLSDAGLTITNNDIDVDKMVEFASGLEKLGPAVKAYSESMQGVDTESITSTKEAITTIVDISKSMKNVGGILQEITGVPQDMAAFAEDLAPLGPALVAYSQSMQGFDVETVNNSNSAVKTLVDIANTIPEEDGWLQSLVGRIDVANFGSKLESFGKSLVAYSDSVSGISSSTFDESSKAVEGLVEMYNAIHSGTESTAWWEFWESDGIENFKNGVTKLGEGLKAFQEAAVGSGKVEDITNMVDGLYKLSNFINNCGKLKFGNIDTFAENVSKLAEVKLGDVASQFADQAESFSSIGTDIMTAIADGIDAGGSLVTTAFDTVISTVCNSVSVMAGPFEISGIAAMMAFAVGMKQGADVIPAAIEEALTAVVTHIVSAAAVFMEAGSECMSSLGEGISNGSTTAAVATTPVIVAIINYINSTRSQFIAAGNRLMTSLALGITVGALTVYSTIRTIMSGIGSAFSSGYSTAFSAGVNIMNGLMAGMNQQAGAVMQMARNIANSVSATIKNALDIHSPSKVFIAIGENIMEGWIKGLANDEGDLYAKGKENARNIVSIVGDAIDLANQMVSDGVDLTPVITPVVNTSMLEQGVNRMNSLLMNTDATIQASSLSVDSISNQNGLLISNSKMMDSLSGKLDRFIDVLETGDASQPIEVRSVIEMNGREMAHALASDIRTEINSIDNLRRRVKGMKT